LLQYGPHLAAVLVDEIQFLVEKDVSDRVKRFLSLVIVVCFTLTSLQPPSAYATAPKGIVLEEDAKAQVEDLAARTKAAGKGVSKVHLHRELAKPVKSYPLDAKPAMSLGSDKFIVGGINSNEAIDNLKAINRIPIAVIEKRAREQGLIGPDESIKEVMKRDNEYVLLRGLNHPPPSQPPLPYPLTKVLEILLQIFFY